MLQSENAILRKRLGKFLIKTPGQEEQMQVEALVTQEIHKMSLPELKSKIIKLAQAYRGERMRNEEYEKALKSAQIEISNARKLANQLDQIQKVHEEDSKKFLDLQRETQQIGLFRETIRKQEEVIKKLEGLLNKTVDESRKQKESLLELEQLRTENLKLQRELKEIVVNSNPGVIGKTNPAIESYRKEIKRLENQVKTLQEELNSKRPLSSNKKEMQNEMLDLEVKLHRTQAR
jgi:myosin heavy subunit